MVRVSNRTRHFLDRLIESVKITRYRCVPLHASHIAPDKVHGLIELVMLTACDEYVSSLLYKQFCCLESHARGCCGYKGDFSIKLSHISSFESRHLGERIALNA